MDNSPHLTKRGAPSGRRALAWRGWVTWLALAAMVSTVSGLAAPSSALPPPDSLHATELSGAGDGLETTEQSSGEAGPQEPTEGASEEPNPTTLTDAPETSISDPTDAATPQNEPSDEPTLPAPTDESNTVTPDPADTASESDSSAAQEPTETTKPAEHAGAEATADEPKMAAALADDGFVTAAATNPDGTLIRGSQQFYAYVGPGENLDVLFVKESNVDPALDAVITITKPDGTAVTCTVADGAAANTAAGTCDRSDLTSSVPGVWQIEFDTGAGTSSFDRYSWDIAVQSGATDQPGRVWSERYRPAQTGGSPPADIEF